MGKAKRVRLVRARPVAGGVENSTGAFAQVCSLLQLLTPDQLRQVDFVLQAFLANQPMHADRMLSLFYRELGLVLERAGYRAPPLHALGWNEGRKAGQCVRQAWDAVQALARKHGANAHSVEEVAAVTRCVGALAVERLRTLRIPVTLLGVCQQLRHADALLDHALPDYPSVLVRQVLAGRWARRSAQNRVF